MRRRRPKRENPHGYIFDGRTARRSRFTAYHEQSAALNHRPEMGVSPNDVPVFDRGSFEPLVSDAPATVKGPSQIVRRTEADRQPARETVTARVLGDPKPQRAGRAPPCEDSTRAEESAEAYRLLGREPPQEGYGVKDLAKVKARLDRLAPRRYRPAPPLAAWRPSEFPTSNAVLNGGTHDQEDH